MKNILSPSLLSADFNKRLVKRYNTVDEAGAGNISILMLLWTDYLFQVYIIWTACYSLLSENQQAKCLMYIFMINEPIRYIKDFC